MASGVGNVFILPRAISTWDQQLTRPDNQGWFGGLSPGGPMADVRNTMNWGRLGGFQATGPQSTQYQQPTSPLGDASSAGLNSALFGSSYNPAAGQSAYSRFFDSGDSYLRRYGTDVREDPAHPGVALQPMLDAQGNPVGFGQGVKPNPAYYSPNAKTLIESPERSAGQRSGALFGGRGPNGEPLFGSQSDTAKTYAGLAQLQQGANPWLNDPRMQAQMIAQSESDSPFARADPTQYLATMLGAEGTSPTVASAANSYVNPGYQQAGRGVGQMGGLVNSYEQMLMDQMQQQGSKDLSLGLQDAQSTLSSMGLGRSGQGQSTAAGVWEDIQQKNALQRQQLMSQFAEAGMGRQAQAILGQQTIGGNLMSQAQQAAAQGAESRLGRANQAAMGGQNALTASLEASRAAQRGGMSQGLINAQGWNQNVGQNYLNALNMGDTSAINRMTGEANAQSQGLGDYMRLQQMKDSMRTDRLNELLALEDRQQLNQQGRLSQQMQFGMLPWNAAQQMLTGLPSGGVTQPRQSPWGPLLAGAGLNFLGNTATQMIAPQQQNSPIYDDALRSGQ